MDLAVQCLATRSTDGHIRQQALRLILYNNEPWAIPYVVLLAAEYVVEIVADIQVALPSLDCSAYANFVHENYFLMRVLRARATSYWDCYYRGNYPNQNSYPGLIVLRQFEKWASQ
jgi:hypothetical protein